MKQRQIKIVESLYIATYNYIYGAKIKGIKKMWRNFFKKATAETKL